MLTTTAGVEDISIKNIVDAEPFVFESGLQYDAQGANRRDLSYSLAYDPAVVRLLANTQDGQQFEVIFDEPNTQIGKPEWMLSDSPHGMKRFVLRRATIIRNRIRVLPVTVSGVGGVGVSDDFRQLILLDGDGRRLSNVSPYDLKEVKVDLLSVDK